MPKKGKLQSIVDYKRGQKYKYRVYKGLLSRDFTKEESAVIMGNLRQESAFDVEAELRGRNPKTGKREDSYGLMQWRASRLDDLKELAKKQGKEISSLDVQLDFIKQELKGKGYEARQFKKAMEEGWTLSGKTMAFAKYVERPHKDELKRGSTSYKNRTKAASEFYDLDDNEVDSLIKKYDDKYKDIAFASSPEPKPEFNTEITTDAVKDYMNTLTKLPSEMPERDFVTRHDWDIEEVAEELPEEEIVKEDKVDLDSMNFKDAFDSARSNGENVFSWKGKKYTTEVKGEEKKKNKIGLSFEEKMKAISNLKPKGEGLRDDINMILNEDVESLVPEIDEDTPLLASTDEDFGDFIPKKDRAPEMTEESSLEEEELPEIPSGLPLDRLGGSEQKPLTTIEQDIKNITFEGMGDDIVNKFVDRNAIGFLTQGAIKHSMIDRKVDPTFNIEEGMDKELFTEMTKGLEAEDIADLVDNANSRGDFIKTASLLQGRTKRKKEMEKYTQEHPVFSGINSVGNILVEGAIFMPLGTGIAAAGQATKLRHLNALSKMRVGKYLLAEAAEQGIQELIWKVNDREYEFDPLLFATGVGVGVGLRTVVGAAEADAALRQILKNEGGFINIATDEGKKLVDEVAKNVSNNKAIELAQRVTKKKIKVANEIRKNLEAKRASIVKRLDDATKKLKTEKDKKLIKSLKGKKQRAARGLEKFDKNLPDQLEMLMKGTHPKLTAQVNPEFTLTKIAKEVGIDPKTVNTPEKVRAFLGLNQPNVNPDFVIEGEKGYQRAAREQVKEMTENKRLNMNETLRYMSGSDTVKTLDELPVIGRLQLGDKLMSLAETDGPVSRFLFNKGNLVSSDNELVSSFYNWMAPDGMGRQGMSKIRAIESQQKYANIYGGELMNMYHTHGTKMYDAIEGKMSRAKGFFSPDSYEETVEPILKERLLTSDASVFRAKYGDEVANAADDFYNDFNKLNKRIVERMKELDVKGVDFEATDGWFHRSWDFRKARSVDTDDLNDTVFRAMKSHAETLGVKNIDDAKLMEHAKRFAYGLKKADMSTIEAMQADHIKLLEKLLRKSEGLEAKTIKDEVSRLKYLKSKAEAGDLANRVQMDVSQTLSDGRPLSDLFEDNVINTQKRYTARMSARIAAAEHGIKNIDELDEWIDDAVKMEVERLAKKGVKNPAKNVEFIKQAMKEDLMSFKHGGMVGLHDLPDDAANDMVRLVKKYNYARLMQYTGISSIAELGGTFVEAGVSTTLGEMSRYMRNHFNDLFIDSPDQYVGRLYDELRTVVGVGMEDFSFSTKGMSKANRIYESGVANVFEKGVDVLGRTAQAPFGGIEKVGRRLTVNSLAIKWANHFNETETGGILSAFFGSNGVTNRVLENSGFGKIDAAGKFIANDNYKNIKKAIKEFADFDESGRLVKLNLDKWDTNTAHAFGDAIQMQANHIMVSPDSTTMALWQSSTVGQILNQFRTFTINATTKVMGATISNAAISANRGDMSETIKAGQKIFWGTSLGMLSVAVRQGIQRAGGDKEVDLFDEGLIKAAAIGFSRSSVAGNLPTIGDTISGSFGYDPIFDKTSSVGRSKNFFNLSTTPTGQAIGGVITSGEKALQGDFKDSGMQLMKTSPLYRQIGVQQIFNFVDDEK